MPAILDHSIVGQHLLPNLTVRKDRNIAGCRICGVIFQPAYYINSPNLNDRISVMIAEEEIANWRVKHAKTHPSSLHEAFKKTGLTFTAEAAHRLAPFGIVPFVDAYLFTEHADALITAPRAPVDDVETTLRNWR